MSAELGWDGRETLDDVLMSQVADGNASAFEVLARRHMRRALAIAQGVVGNPSDADEIAQEAFMRVWEFAGRWTPGRAQFTTWLHRIVLNLSLDRRRKPQWVAFEAVGEVADDREPSATETVARRERESAIERAMRKIPPRQRAAISLFYFEGLSGKAASDALGISVAAFEQLLLRARRAIKAELATAGLDLQGGMP
ncbi:sigma-70 family RNA polymerase sigma factor [Telmatospirillum sp.]|uniref:sigma-70 family RNA polymerase sigma factor n=1 Tax=Telmatospirillum sp. TaxID=2079197 RepID=UPI00284BE765|nr:sigma-70 family RNA polymerase sigma factor [Telmatospirillum sp.]MDR3440907.1 sigma-70 family RNA polymerase sigma factor [Telmatospirillum sp.]